jgi:integrase
MCLFKINTGCREQELCQLRWDWEVDIPELDTSVFIVPGRFVKNGEDRLVVLNQVAASVIREVRGTTPRVCFHTPRQTGVKDEHHRLASGEECNGVGAGENRRP